MNNINNKFRGCIIGGAAGDALGYAVEFDIEEFIFMHYGERGITEYKLKNGIARISDDTQMTLSTAVGLINAKVNHKNAVFSDYVNEIYASYREWVALQVKDAPEDIKKKSWLCGVDAMHASRAPGRTCIQNLIKDLKGSLKYPLNNSKGCGGVMRVAPIGLMFDSNLMNRKDLALLGAEASVLTHGHELGFIPSAMLVNIINQLTYSDINLKDAVINSLEFTIELFKNAEYIKEFEDLMIKAIGLSDSDLSDLECIHALGEGWVGEEALAIAVFCALRYSDDFEKAIVAAVNHKGDSDSTGAICGNILGAYLGYEAIPQKFIDNLEAIDVLNQIADDLQSAKDFEPENIPENLKKYMFRAREMGYLRP